MGQPVRVALHTGNGGGERSQEFNNIASKAQRPARLSLFEGHIISTMTNYQYTELKTGETRILSVLPADDFSDPIRISIRHTRLPPSCFGFQHHAMVECLTACGLSDADKYPEYYALSYVWGSAENPKLVYVDAAPEAADTISITNNLDAALRHIRRKKKPLVIWIDAICIDQGNLEERGLQVALMDIIYTAAKKVLIWLGPEEHGSHQVMQRLAWMGERLVVHDGFVAPNPTGPPLGPDEANWLSLTEALPGSEYQLRDLVSFFERPWFGRLWIRQEIFLARQALVVCGKTILSWELFRSAAICLAAKGGFKEHEMSLIDIRFNKIKGVVLNVCSNSVVAYPCSYRYLRWDHQGIQFTDPRDAIYAIKSIVHPGDAALDIQPDYTIETAELFQEVCVRLFERQRRTDFLYSCELASIATYNLPTWVPDWATSPSARHLETNWSACGFLSAQGSHLGEGILRVSGIRIGQVHRVKAQWREMRPLNLWEFVYFVHESFPDPYDFDREYKEGVTYIDAYCRVLMAEKFREVIYPPKEDLMITLSFPRAKRALFKIRYFDSRWDDITVLAKDPDVVALFYQGSHVVNKYFIRTKEGWQGLAPQNTREGDIVCVVLGCRFPMVLRKDTWMSTPDRDRWKVVGPCQAEEFMSGQAIYGDKVSHVYRRVKLRHGDTERFVDGEHAGLQELSTGAICTDPVEVLVKMLGIQPSVWSRWPHRLEVPPDTLRAAGVKLRDFDLV